MLSNFDVGRALMWERAREAERYGRESLLLRDARGEAVASVGRAPEVVIRLCRATDDDGLQRLAALESRRLPRGSFVLAELDGELVAAVALAADDRPFADPFRRTAEIVPLLELRARQLRAARRVLAPRRRRFRFAAWSG